jgi:diacylglycerol O-acyltransferase
MAKHRLGDRLSWGDSVFLYLERDGMPLNVGSVMVLEGKVSLGAFTRFVESKLPLLPRYLQRVVAPPFNLGLPSWEWDPEFDIHRHVREVTLKHGSDTELKTVAGKIFSQVMDRQHPLWDLTLIHGLQGNRTGLLARIHHCLADGIAGVGVMNVIMDASPVVPRLPKKKLELQIPPPHNPLASFIDGLVNSYSNYVERILSAHADVLSIAERIAGQGGTLSSDELSHLLPEITAFTERLHFNVPYRGPQKFAYTEIPLPEVKAIRHARGASVNDVILALVTATIRRYSELHGERVKGRLLRIMVPVNMRGGDGNASELGNRISLVAVTIPLDIRNPRKLLDAVHKRTEFLKRVHAPELVSLTGGLIGMFPTSAQALAGPIASQLPITPFNLVCTNVPGPQVPLYVLGCKLLRWYPYVPVGGEMTVNCAVLSYDGAMYFGFSGDVHAAPDLRRLEALLELSFTELCSAVGIEPPRKKTVRTKAQTVAAPVSAPPATVRVSIPFPAALTSVEPAKKKEPAKEEEIVRAPLSA